MLRPGGQRLELALPELDNFRASLEWAVESASVALGLEIATALDQLWTLGHPEEGIRWFARLLDRPEADLAPPSLRAHALRAYGSYLYLAGRHPPAESAWERSLAIFEELHDEHGRAVLLHRLGLSAMVRGDLETARELVVASDEIHGRRGDVWGRAQTVGALGAIARDEGDAHRALDLVRESAVLAREANVPWWECGALAEAACTLLTIGEIDQGEAHARESLVIAERLGYRSGRIFGVGILARVAAERSQDERAGRLWGAIQNEEAGAPLGGWRRHRQECESRIRELVGSEFERGCEEGRSGSLDDAVALALS